MHVDELSIVIYKGSSQFFAVPSLQQLFNRDCCLYRIGFFIEFYCILAPPCAALEKAQLVHDFFLDHR